MLDARTDAERAAQLQFADAAQWEYEDEYDDSYDDLAPFGNDGVADVEGAVTPLVCIHMQSSAVLLTTKATHVDQLDLGLSNVKVCQGANVEEQSVAVNTVQLYLLCQRTYNLTHSKSLFVEAFPAA